MPTKETKKAIKKEIVKELKNIPKNPKKRVKNKVYKNLAMQTTVADDKAAFTREMMNGYAKSSANVRSNVHSKITSMQGPRNAKSRAATAVIEAITLPAISRSVRLATQLGTKPTAVAAPMFREDVLFGAGVNQLLSDQQFWLFRSALRAAIRQIALPFQPAPAAPSVIYSGNHKMNLQPSTPVNFQPLALAFGSPSDSPAFSLGSNPNLNVHGQFLYPVIANKGDQRRGFWVDGGSALIFGLNPPPGTFPASGCKVQFYILNGEEWQPQPEVILTGAAPVVQFSNFLPGEFLGGYIAIEVTNLNAAATSASFFAQATMSICNSYNGTVHIVSIYSVFPLDATCADAYSFGHLSLPDLERNFQSVKALRVTGASLMFTNNAAPTARQGQYAAVQLESGTHWMNSFGYKTLAKNRLTHTDDVMEGVYGFLKLTNETDFNFLNEFVVGDVSGVNYQATGPQGLISTGVVCTCQSDYITVCLNIDPTAPRSGQLTYGYQVEYETQDTWRQLDLPQISYHVVRPALEQLQSCPQFHRNENHLENIWNWIKSTAGDVVNAIGKYGPMVVEGAAMLAPLLL